MVFHPPSWVPSLKSIPDDVTVEAFISERRYGGCARSQAKDPYTCGITGQSHTAVDVVQRTDFVARALAKRLGFAPHLGTEWDKVVAIYSVNAIDYIPVTHAVHRLNGIVTPANAAYSPAELEHQLRSSGAKALFTCETLLPNALKAANAAGISKDNIFLVSVPGIDSNKSQSHTTVDDLVAEGGSLSPTPDVRFIKGQGARQVAYLCYSSGTSGQPKAVMISHYNLIANILQSSTFDGPAYHDARVKTQSIIGVLPFSHIYALTLVAHVSQYRGDQVIVLPRFELKTFLGSIQEFGVSKLNVVPPILIQMTSSQELCKKYDLSSVRFVLSGAAPLGPEIIDKLVKLYPQWRVGQAYGMTESSPLAFSTSESDIFKGSSGSLVPDVKALVVDTDDKEITQLDTPGELLLQGPNITLGYLENEEATAETFISRDNGRWLRTGDVVLVRKSPQGHEHFFVVDRIKELIKVKGFQVAPAELEAHLLAHPYVADCAVIATPDATSGEAPKAFIVKSKQATAVSDDEADKEIRKHVEQHKARYKWLKAPVHFIDAIPKSPSGKILRRTLRDRYKPDQGPTSKL